MRDREEVERRNRALIQFNNVAPLFTQFGALPSREIHPNVQFPKDKHEPSIASKHSYSSVVVGVEPPTPGIDNMMRSLSVEDFTSGLAM
jgi:hypothetical protein